MDDHKITPHLYINQFVITILIDRHDDEIWFLDYNIPSSTEGHLEGLSMIPSILLQEVQNIVVVIHIDYGKDTEPQTEVDTFNNRSFVADLIRPLRLFGALQDLEIHVNNIHGLAKDNPCGNDILDSLQEFRRLKSVTIHGTSPAHATKIKAIMAVKVQVLGHAKLYLWLWLIPGHSSWNSSLLGLWPRIRATPNTR